MKRIFFAAILSMIAANAFAQASDYQTNTEPGRATLPSVHNISVNVTPQFYFKPYLSIEYSAPVISGGGSNVDFKSTKELGGQIKNFQNIAIGGHFRVQKYLGFNLNWAHNELENNMLNGAGLARQAYLNISQINASALIFAPIVQNTLELFAEVGASDMNSKINYIDGSGNFFSAKNHQTKAFLGGGVQVNFNKTSTVRFSFQKYSGKLALVDSHYTTLRIGYLHAF